MAETWEELENRVQRYLNTGEPLGASRLMFEMLTELHTRCLKMQEELDRLRGEDQDEGLPTLPGESYGDSPQQPQGGGSDRGFGPVSRDDSIAGRIASG